VVTERSGEQHVDLAAIQADDALLDALGRGEPAPDGDDLAGLLAAWRAELATDLPSDTVDPPAGGTVDELAFDLPSATVELPADGNADERPTDAAHPPVVEPVPLRRRRAPGLRRALVGAVAAAVLVGGAALGAQRSGPDGPLWPITRVMYPQLIDVREAEHAIAQAHDAIAAGRYDDARRLLDVAAGHTDHVTDPATRQRLRDRIEQLRQSLPAAAGPTVGTVPTAPTAPTTPAPTAAPIPTPAPGTTTPAPAPGAGGIQAPAPGDPGPGQKSLLPSLPVPKLPIPTLPLPPSLLPTLPGLG
jgi:hypothetical protein